MSGYMTQFKCPYCKTDICYSIDNEGIEAISIGNKIADIKITGLYDRDGVNLNDKIKVIEQCINTITGMRYRKGIVTASEIVTEFIKECESLKGLIKENDTKTNISTL